jgi:hypothetical protein
MISTLLEAKMTMKMKKNRRSIRTTNSHQRFTATAAALIVSSKTVWKSSLLVAATECIHDRHGHDEADTGCSISTTTSGSSGGPFCVNADGYEPPLQGVGVQCAPCLAYFDHPAQPDWGCTDQAPLCIIKHHSDDDTDTRSNENKNATTTTIQLQNYHRPMRDRLVTPV